MNKKRFSAELLWENVVGVVLAIVVLVGIAFSAFFVFDNSKKNANKNSTPTLKPENTIAAKSVNDSDIEKLYQQKRKENADKKEAEAAEKKRLKNEKQRLADEKKKLEALAKKKSEEAAAEKQRIKRERATLADQKKQADVAAKKAEKQKKEADAAAKKAEKQKELADQATKKAATEKRQADVARRKAEAERKIIDEKKRVAAEKAKAEKAKAEKAKAEKAKAEKAEKEKVEAEEKRQAEIAQEKANAEKARIAKELGADIASREIDEMLSRFGVAISSKVKSRWVIPAKLPAGLSAKVQIQMANNGQVKSAKITRSSGNVAFDNSAIQAVKQASPLPMPEKKEWADEFAIINLDFP